MVMTTGHHDLIEEKSALRQQVREAREATTQREQKSHVIAERVLALPQVKEAQTVFLYAAVGSEVGTDTLVKRLFEMGKTIAMPLVVDEGRMLPIILERPGDLIDGEFGIPAPAGTVLLNGCPDVTILPGIAMTLRGERLGQGGGFYDRYLERACNTFALALAFESQIVDAIPTTDRDARVNAIATEDRLVICA